MMKTTDISSQMLAASLHPLLNLLHQNADFFDAADKKKMIVKHALSDEIGKYILGVSSDTFFKQLKALLKGSTDDNKLTEALVLDICESVFTAYDHLPDDFGSQPLVQREGLVNELPTTSSIKALMLNFTRQELESAAQNLLSELTTQLHSVIIETPRPITSALRAAMRKRYQPHTVFFHYNPSLLGGLRVLENGKMFDYSWSGKIQQWANQPFSF